MHQPLDPQVASLLGAGASFGRRRFLVSSLGSGFALAVLPVSAQTIHTSSAGLIAGEVKVPVRDGQIPAYRAMPANGGDLPVILVVQEIFGVHEWIRDVCRRLAKMGYYAIAPALYAREGDPEKLANVSEIVERIVSKVTDAQVMSDLDATAAYAKSTGKVDAAKLGVTGFCWGGRMVWLYAAHDPNLKAAVAWYGDVSRSYRRGEQSALQLIPDLKAPVLGLYGGKDEGIPVDSVRRAEARMKAAGKTGEIVVYPQADHGFLADYRPSYDEAAAQDGWKRMSAWFRRYL